MKTKLPIDPGSQNTYHSDAVRDNLLLDAITKQNAVINKSGSTSGNLKELDEFKISFWGLNENVFVVYMSGFSVPVVSSPASSRKTDFLKNS